MINRLKPEEGEWERYLTKPLFEGIEEEDDRVAYHRFVKGSEGDFHFIWMWRWTPMVETGYQIMLAGDKTPVIAYIKYDEKGLT